MATGLEAEADIILLKSEYVRGCLFPDSPLIQPLGYKISRAFFKHVLIQLHKKKSSISGKALSAIGLISPQWLLFSFCSPFLNKASRFMSLCQSIIHVL